MSRTQVYQIAKGLIQDGRLVRIGSTRNVRYVAPSEELRSAIAARPLSVSQRYGRENLDENEAYKALERKTNILELLPVNVLDIVRSAFTEMLNNAIDHSRSRMVAIEMSRLPDQVEFEVRDQGVGIFENLRHQFKFTNEREALLDLVKGKRTTASSKHSGEGIFFTSRSADTFSIESGGLRLIVNNLIDDVFLESRPRRRGTIVRFGIATTSKRTMRSVYDRYSSVEEGFVGTDYRVKLVTLDDVFASRSQAKRIMSGMERFKRVELDFASVRFVGQGFADEVLRVWRSRYPDTDITWLNANTDITFMLERVMKPQKT